jgi:hypothetical protein
VSLQLREGDRIEVVRWYIDEGLRLWPVLEDGRPAGAEWRVMNVLGQRDEDITEVGRVHASDVATKYPDYTYSINDNESVPPGTRGTVSHVNEVGLGFSVEWDNGSGLHPTDRDEWVKLRSGDNEKIVLVNERSDDSGPYLVDVYYPDGSVTYFLNSESETAESAAGEWRKV